MSVDHLEYMCKPKTVVLVIAGYRVYTECEFPYSVYI